MGPVFGVDTSLMSGCKVVEVFEYNGQETDS